METTTYEIATDELTLQPDKADSAVAFLDQWSNWLARIIDIIMKFFDELKGIGAE